MDEETAADVRRRRMRMGLSLSRLATEAGLDRGTVKRLEDADPNTRDATVGSVMTTLERLEHEMGMDAPPSAGGGEDLVEYHVSGNFGVDVVVKGPVRDAEQLEASVARLIERMQRAQD